MNLLDTGMVIRLLREKKFETGHISVITLVEILRGLEDDKRSKVKELLEESFIVDELDNETIQAYCNLYRRLKKEGASLPDADLLIAATAISHNAILRTSDQHFTRLADLGLKLAPG